MLSQRRGLQYLLCSRKLRRVPRFVSLGLREGLEVSLIIGILLAYVTRLSRGDVKRKIWLGVWTAVGICLGLGALFTFGRYGLSFQAQEIIDGSMSLLAVGMITWMVFFAWTGAFLIVVAAGVLAYGIHDMQEAAVLAGPFSGRPVTPTDFRTGEVLTGFDGPFWLAAFLKGIFGFVPQMTWLEVTAWAFYIGIVMPLFLRQVFKQSREAKSREAAQQALLTKHKTEEKEPP